MTSTARREYAAVRLFCPYGCRREAHRRHREAARQRQRRNVAADCHGQFNGQAAQGTSYAGFSDWSGQPGSADVIPVRCCAADSGSGIPAARIRLILNGHAQNTFAVARIKAQKKSGIAFQHDKPVPAEFPSANRSILPAFNGRVFWNSRRFRAAPDSCLASDPTNIPHSAHGRIEERL